MFLRGKVSVPLMIEEFELKFLKENIGKIKRDLFPNSNDDIENSDDDPAEEKDDDEDEIINNINSIYNDRENTGITIIVNDADADHANFNHDDSRSKEFQNIAPSLLKYEKENISNQLGLDAEPICKNEIDSEFSDIRNDFQLEEFSTPSHEYPLEPLKKYIHGKNQDLCLNDEHKDSDQKSSLWAGRDLNAYTSSTLTEVALTSTDDIQSSVDKVVCKSEDEGINNGDMCHSTKSSEISNNFNINEVSKLENSLADSSPNFSQFNGCKVDSDRFDDCARCTRTVGDYSANAEFVNWNEKDKKVTEDDIKLNGEEVCIDLASENVGENVLKSNHISNEVDSGGSEEKFAQQRTVFIEFQKSGEDIVQQLTVVVSAETAAIDSICDVFGLPFEKADAKNEMLKSDCSDKHHFSSALIEENSDAKSIFEQNHDRQHSKSHDEFVTSIETSSYSSSIQIKYMGSQIDSEEKANSEDFLTNEDKFREIKQVNYNLNDFSFNSKGACEDKPFNQEAKLKFSAVAIQNSSHILKPKNSAPILKSIDTKPSEYTDNIENEKIDPQYDLSNEDKSFELLSKTPNDISTGLNEDRQLNQSPKLKVSARAMQKTPPTLKPKSLTPISTSVLPQDFKSIETSEYTTESVKRQQSDQQYSSDTLNLKLSGTLSPSLSKSKLKQAPKLIPESKT
jgi:hypothetical protein